MLKKHGMSHQRLHNIWCSMRQRCEKPSCSGYWKYGAKGIRVCEEWSSFEAFRDWAYENGYTDELTIDRINTKGNYEPGNCRWVTQKVQQNNRSNNIIITYNGETHNIEEWSKITGIPYSVIYGRNHLGWSPERTFQQKVRKSPEIKEKQDSNNWTKLNVYYDKTDTHKLVPIVHEMLADTEVINRCAEGFGRHDAATYTMKNGEHVLYWGNKTGITIDFRKNSIERMYRDKRPEDWRGNL